MKKLAVFLLAVSAGLFGAARYVPEFWAYVPASATAVVRDYVPKDWHAFIALPALPEPAKAVAGAGGAQAQAGGGRNAGGARGGGAQQGRPTPVVTAPVLKKTVPFRLEAIGTVQTIASVTVRARIDSQIDQILFSDGADVKQGDLLAKLDSRAIEAQLRQAEANLARDRVSFELSKRTFKRGEDLASQNFATQQRLDENRAAMNALEAQVKADDAQVENLRTQLSYYTIKAPISGKAGLANLKPGNMARSSDGAIAITTINQISPIYISFSLPQRYLQDLRESIARGDSRIEALPQGSAKAATGKLALVENAMDNTTGTIGVRGIFDNADEALWPGSICNIKVTLRNDADMIVVPRESVMLGQKGNYVFVVVDGTAKLQPVTVSRTVDSETIVTSGLKGGETVITDGQLLVIAGSRVQPRGGQSSSLPGEQPASKL